MNHLIADRRLYLTEEKDQVVEEGDPNGAWLLYAVGRVVGAGDVERFDMGEDDFGRVVYDGCPKLRRPKAEIADAAEDKSDDSDRNQPVPEWTGRTSPEAYLKRYPTGPKAKLADAVIAARVAAILVAQDDGAGGAT